MRRTVREKGINGKRNRDREVGENMKRQSEGGIERERKRRMNDQGWQG